MPRGKCVTERVPVVVRLPEKIRDRLAELADDRDMTLEAFCSEILEVATIEKGQILKAEYFLRKADPSMGVQDVLHKKEG